MFSGIIKNLGVIEKALNGKIEGEIVVSNSEIPSIVEIGGSVSVNGACLTATHKTQNTITFFVSYETSERSTISKLKVGTIVNLELPSTPTTFLDGHIVLGHVDTTGRVYEISNIGDSFKLSISVSKEFMKNVVFKGSVAIDGISLTVYEVNDSLNTFSVSVIPHTYNNTNLKYLKVSDYVNVEFDIIGKYVERLLSIKDKPSTIDKLRDFLGT